ncbi:hypothetical protein Q2T41_16575 [Maribacter confluentis]|uniref:Uncharacterized protein n=1 Tax=Maribacter confluentis TaxID=1656093 RepID=A0ABT8RU59_9FLAO|nr:hypothetical protein [Maribacter confluentis]MDO1514270.1 hypothetical protein [Maribacter confluentis]
MEVLCPDGKFQKLDNIKANEKIVLENANAALVSLNELKFPLAQNLPETIF